MYPQQQYPQYPQYPQQQYQCPFPCPPPAYVGFQWVPAHGSSIPPNAVVGGRDCDGSDLYIARAHHNGSVIPGKGHPQHGCCFVAFGGKEIAVTDYEVLVGPPGAIPRWQTVTPGMPIQGTQAGHDVGGQPLYVGRVWTHDCMCLGKAAPHLNGINVSYSGKEHVVSGQTFEILIL
eukprot:m51a1_g6040 hypothetical protein (176) ;mRNA; f:164328-165059